MECRRIYNLYSESVPVKECSLVKYLCFLLGIVLLFSIDSSAQIYRIGGGLSFASGTEFNAGETGNPGLSLKTWIPLDKRRTISIVPSISAYNRYRLETGFMILTNYMFHGDLNVQYAFFEEGTVRAVAMGGANFTYLISKFEPIVVTGNEILSDAQDYAIGGNVGAGLELRMASQWDFNVSGKYLFSNYKQFIITVEAVYYFKKRRRAYRR
ncbi:MAG: hypothetical protein KAT15_19380 [Bacteroidales bacterium]|nr:hypothetical protein [Bacteroidales bacterium]